MIYIILHIVHVQKIIFKIFDKFLANFNVLDNLLIFQVDNLKIIF
jgi:hypothetical protein